jgi:hypothetical protein
MASSITKATCPICGLAFYDLDFHIRVDEECPEIADLRDPGPSALDRTHPNGSGVWTVQGVGRLLRVIYWN